MARGHASGIKIREAPPPFVPVDEPRVVIAVETDARKVPTGPRMVEGRDDGARAVLLPSTPDGATMAATRAERPERAPSKAPASRGLPTWTRATLALALLVAGFGAAHQYGSLTQRVRIVPRIVAMLRSLPPPAPAPAPIAAAVEHRIVVEPPPPPVEVEPPPPAPPPRRPAIPPRPRVAARPAPQAAPAPDHLPPFQLPAEKKHD